MILTLSGTDREVSKASSGCKLLPQGFFFLAMAFPLLLRRLAATLAVLVSGLAGAGCINVTPPGVLFATQPPGARVMLDEVDSGFVTPCLIDLDDTQAHEIRLELQGYEPRSFRVLPGHRVMFVPWYHAVSPESLHFPLFATQKDLFFPFRVDRNLVPGRVHVRLHPLGAE